MFILIQIITFIIDLIIIWFSYFQFNIFDWIIRTCDQFPEYWE